MGISTLLSSGKKNPVLRGADPRVDGLNLGRTNQISSVVSARNSCKSSITPAIAHNVKRRLDRVTQIIPCTKLKTKCKTLRFVVPFFMMSSRKCYLPLAVFWAVLTSAIHGSQLSFVA